MNYCKAALSVLLICGFTVASPAGAVPMNDFDGDGNSDPLLVTIAEDSTLNWKVISGATGSELSTVETFGLNGDHVTAGRWLSTTRSSLGLVELRGASLVWSVRRDDGTITTREFGTVGDTVVAGGDFDGNGIADGAIVSPKGRRLFWTVRRALFSRTGGAVRTRVNGRLVTKRLPSNRRLSFGSPAELPFFADPNGRGDWLGSYNSAAQRVVLKNAYTGRVRRIALTGFVPGSLPPLPLKRAGGGDLLAFPVRGETTTKISFVSLPGGQLVSEVELDGTGELITGSFTQPQQPEIAIQRAGGEFVVLNAVTLQQQVVSWGEGVAIDAININTPAPVELPPEPVDHVDNPPPPVGTLEQICTTMHPMDRSVLYKPGSQGTSDSRTGRPAFLWYDCVDPGVQRLYVLAKNGAQIGVMGLYPVSCPLVRFYSGYAPGTMETGSDLAQKASAAAGSRSIYIYTQGGNCWGPVRNPEGRSGGR